jgi:uncharacterized protein YggU (UPF0235/DUF167 family)
MARDNDLPDLSDLALPGAVIALRVTPRAACDGVERLADGTLALRTTAPPAEGRANDAARRLLARAMGVAPTRLVLVRGAASRDKAFRLD